MKYLLSGICLAMVLPVSAAIESESNPIDAQFHELDIHWEALRDAEATIDEAQGTAIRAVTLTNNSAERVLCAFLSASEEQGRTPKLVLEPNDRAVLRVPAQDSKGAVRPTLECVAG